MQNLPGQKRERETKRSHPIHPYHTGISKTQDMHEPMLEYKKRTVKFSTRMGKQTRIQKTGNRRWRNKYVCTVKARQLMEFEGPADGVFGFGDVNIFF